jgi:hypothetical protein
VLGINLDEIRTRLRGSHCLRIMLARQGRHDLLVRRKIHDPDIEPRAGRNRARIKTSARPPRSKNYAGARKRRSVLPAHQHVRISPSLTRASFKATQAANAPQHSGSLIGIEFKRKSDKSHKWDARRDSAFQCCS